MIKYIKEKCNNILNRFRKNKIYDAEVIVKTKDSLEIMDERYSKIPIFNLYWKSIKFILILFDVCMFLLSSMFTVFCIVFSLGFIKRFIHF